MKRFEKEIQERFIVYCETADNNASSEEIVKTYDRTAEKINMTEFENSEEIQNSSRIYTLSDGRVLQALGRLSDVHNVIIPNAYYVRQIGVWFVS